MMRQLYTEVLAWSNSLEAKLKEAEENVDAARTVCSKAVNKGKADAVQVKELEKELAEARQAGVEKLVAEKKASYDEGFEAAEAAYEKQVEGILQDCKKIYSDGIGKVFKLGYVSCFDALSVGPEDPHKSSVPDALADKLEMPDLPEEEAQAKEDAVEGL